jgi:hypothetical protein
MKGVYRRRGGLKKISLEDIKVHTAVLAMKVKRLMPATLFQVNHFEGIDPA